MAAVPSGFCAIVARVLTYLNHELELCGRGSVRAIKSCLPRVYPWRHARDKMYQVLPNLSRESLGTRLYEMHIDHLNSDAVVCIQFK